jgi:hypothetical protein
MASSTPKRKTRAASSGKRARSLSRDAVKTAERLTLHVLQGGKSSLPARRADLAERPKKRKRGVKTGGNVRRAAQVAPIGLKADVTPKLLAAAPAFGDVLRSIAHAVAVTQTALDETALESLKTLSGQQVNVPVLIEQTLDENGKPTSVHIATASMPLTSIITPSMQQVDQMTLRMDMRVQSFDSTSGIKFNQNMASAGVSYSMHSFGFAVAVNNTNVNAQFSNMSDFSSGSVMMSLDIVDRTGFQIPTPLEYGIGANLLVRLTSVAQASVTTGTAPNIVTTITRTALLTVKKVSTTGAVTPLNSGDYGVSLPAGLTFTQGPDTTTNLPIGTLRITRTLATTADPYAERKISINLNQLIKEVSFFI